jgi:hypothetical protein
MEDTEGVGKGKGCLWTDRAANVVMGAPPPPPPYVALMTR